MKVRTLTREIKSKLDSITLSVDRIIAVALSWIIPRERIRIDFSILEYEYINVGNVKWTVTAAKVQKYYLFNREFVRIHYIYRLIVCTWLVLKLLEIQRCSQTQKYNIDLKFSWNIVARRSFNFIFRSAN